MKIPAAFGIVLFATVASAGPVAELSTTLVDLGVIEQGSIADVPLSIRNTGDAPLTIKKIQFSCHCVSARELTAEERVVPPGGEQLLPITYDPMNYTGPREALIAVTTDDPNNPFLEARVTTTIVTPVVMTPRVLRWGPTVKGATLDAEIRIKPGIAGADLEVLDIKVPNPDIEFTKSVATEGDETVVQATFQIADSARIGELNTIVEANVRLNDRQFPVRTPLSLYVLGDATVRPPQVVSINRPINPGDQISTVTLLWTQPERPVELLDVAVEGAIRTETRPMPDRFEIDVFVAADAAPGPNAARVQLFTTSSDEPVSSVPIYFLAASQVLADPSAVVLDGGTANVRVQLRSRDGYVAPRSVLIEMEGVTAEPVEDEPGALLVALDGDAPRPLTGHIVVEFDDAPALRIPVIVRDTIP